MTDMTITKTVLPTERKRGMTLGELARFVQEAMKNDIPAETRLTNIRISPTGRLRSITAKADV